VPADAVVFRVGLPTPTAMLQEADRFLAAVIVEPAMTAEQVASLFGPDADVLAQRLQTLFADMLAVCTKEYHRRASEFLTGSLSDLMLDFRIATYRPDTAKHQGLDEFTRRVGVEA
jgi:hypothetical protein